MEQETEFSEYANVQELRRNETKSGDTEQSGRRLLRIGILTLGVLCIIQGILIISLSLAFYSKDDPGQFPFNSSVIADVCQIDQQDSTQFCTCCNNLLRTLLKHYKDLETERDLLSNKVNQLTQDKTIENDFDLESGSGLFLLN